MAETNETDEGFSAQGLSGMARIEALIAPALESMGYGIVRVAFVKGGRATLQIMTERLDGQGMSVDDCADISRAVSAILDVEDPISSAYMLEVSSPGIDRPLVKRADFTRFAGFVAKIETERLIDGRKRFSGRLLGIGEDGLVRVRDEAVEYAVPFDAITKAKLVLTDDLLANSPDRPRT